MTCFLLQVNGAAMEALEESLELLENGALSASSSCSEPSIELRHFEQALSKIKPSVSEQVQDNILNNHLFTLLLHLLVYTIKQHRSASPFSSGLSQQRKHYEALARKHSSS